MRGRLEPNNRISPVNKPLQRLNPPATYQNHAPRAPQRNKESQPKAGAHIDAGSNVTLEARAPCSVLHHVQQPNDRNSTAAAGPHHQSKDWLPSTAGTSQHRAFLPNRITGFCAEVLWTHTSPHAHSTQQHARCACEEPRLSQKSHGLGNSSGKTCVRQSTDGRQTQRKPITALKATPEWGRGLWTPQRGVCCENHAPRCGPRTPLCCCRRRQRHACRCFHACWCRQSRPGRGGCSPWRSSQQLGCQNGLSPTRARAPGRGRG